VDNFVEVLKWIGIVLAAGFIGYFGRYLAMAIIDKMNKKKSASPPAPEPSPETPQIPEVQLEEARLKLEKKKTKAESKRLKKAAKK
jgi:hypothetical protein